MADNLKQQALATLAFASASCTAASASTASTDPHSATLDTVLVDLDGLLALVHSLSTKLALVLKPSSPAYSASIPVLQDIAQHASALAHCARLLHHDSHGATLAKDVRDRVKNILDALRALIQTFINNATRTSHMSASTASNEEYLVRTGVLHDLITNARSTIPKDNQTAVYRAWKSDRASLEDGLQELSRMIDGAECQDDQNDHFDDGWDEIGLGHAASMTKDELVRTKNVHQVLRLTTLLHKRIYLDIIAHPSSATPSAFDDLLTQSSHLLSASDELVAALYPPQDPIGVLNEISKLADIANSLQSRLAIFLSTTDELSNHMHALSLQDGSATPATKKKADRKWFGTCIHQITRLCAKLLSDSSSQAENLSSGTS